MSFVCICMCVCVLDVMETLMSCVQGAEVSFVCLCMCMCMYARYAVGRDGDCNSYHEIYTFIHYTCRVIY